MKNLNKTTALICIIFWASLAGCEKFLAEKTNLKLAVPTRLEDFQALMDNPATVNRSGPGAAEVSSDDYVLTGEEFDALSSDYERRMHIWEKDYVFPTDVSNSWKYTYASIYTANTVLMGIKNIPRTNFNAVAWDNVKGQSLFIRGNNFLDAASIWCLGYDASTASSDLGLPLKMSTNFNEVNKRASVEETYNQIITDLKQSAAILPLVPYTKYRPSKAAAYGLLARVYLAMRNYQEAGLYADSCLSLSSGLIDYNDLDLKKTYLITQDQNKEVIYTRYQTNAIIISTGKVNTPTAVYDTFADDDLRKKIFFTVNTDGSYNFKGDYSAGDGRFSGVATDEVYLIKVEVLARANQYAVSTDLLNAFMLKRWDKSKVYTAYTAVNSTEALNNVLLERRKELMMRGLRWIDIKRLNKEGANITLKRTYHQKEYVLPANDLRFALPIPEDIIMISGMEQNKR